MTNKSSKPLTKADLAHFTGTEQWFRHNMVRHVLYTEGVQYVAEVGGAYWLVDEIAFAQVHNPAVAAEVFQKWILRVKEDYTASLTCENGNCHAVFTKDIEFTDFPLDEISICFSNNVILLPSEW